MRGDIVAFVDRYAREYPALRDDTLTFEDWAELTEICSFLEPFKEVTLLTEGHSASLDSVLTSMDYLVAHFDRYKEAYAGRMHRAMLERVLTGWYKFDHYYQLTDDIPVYAAAILLHPSLRKSYLDKAWKHQSSFIEPAIESVRKLWSVYKPPQVRVACEPTMSQYKRFMRDRTTDMSATDDAFERFILDPKVNVNTTSVIEWWQAEWVETTYPGLSRLARMIFAIAPMSDEPERVFSGAKHTIAKTRTRLTPGLVEEMECIKHWTSRGLLAGCPMEENIQAIEQLMLGEPDCE